ncbi:unnamed protein product [Adineta steineri]|uniref:Uncharacterized protein n=1 Tax=Adineta steineri TaxID=433720 RepID=A0A813WEY7_9BILA|nr:unnamed protein product [Adineta steineri]CAF1505904.1 unnamed protein product [Adineta steineri]
MGTCASMEQEIVCNSLLVSHLSPPRHTLTDYPNYRNVNLKQRIMSDGSRRCVDVNDMKLTDQDMQIVVQWGMIHKKCKSLAVGGNRITSQGVWVIANALCINTTLKHLTLHCNHICDTGTQYLAQTLTLHNSTLTGLALHINDITDVGAGLIAGAIRVNRTLVYVDLSRNRIGDQGAIQLVSAIIQYGDKFERLMLHTNQLITDVSVPTIVRMLEMKRPLETFWVNKCSISDVGRAKIWQAGETRKKFYHNE